MVIFNGGSGCREEEGRGGDGVGDGEGVGAFDSGGVTTMEGVVMGMRLAEPQRFRWLS